MNFSRCHCIWSIKDATIYYKSQILIFINVDLGCRASNMWNSINVLLKYLVYYVKCIGNPIYINPRLLWFFSPKMADWNGLKLFRNCPKKCLLNAGEEWKEKNELYFHYSVIWRNGPFTVYQGPNSENFNYKSLILICLNDELVSQTT